MFEPSPTPRLFGLPPGADFPAELIRGLELRLDGQPPEALAKVELFVNTNRMARRLSAIFADGPPRLLPRIRLVADLGRDPLLTDLPPPVDPLARRLELTRLTAALLRQEPTLAPKSAAFDLADSLAALMDEMQGEAVSPQAIRGLDVSDQSGHWQRALRFLSVIEPFFVPSAAPDPEARQRRVVEALIAKWTAAPPEHPVIVAGSTGSRGTTALLMRAVARLPQGAVILPGLDTDMPQNIWRGLMDDPLGEDHPQYRFARLCADLDCEPSQIPGWTDADPDASRRRLISMALRPAPVTDGWLRDGPALGNLEDATAHIALLEAPSPRLEALSIALRLRAAAEARQVAALITPDRMLTRQVTAALDRWGIEPDDSAGKPLALSAPGRLLRHTAKLMGRPATPEDMLTILKHPLVHKARDPVSGAPLTGELEAWLRRDGPPHPDVNDLRAWAERKGLTGADEWIDWIARTILSTATIGGGALPDLLRTHLHLVEDLATGPNGTGTGTGTGELWCKIPGEAAKAAIDNLAKQAEIGGDMSLTDYRALIDAVLAQEVRDPIRPHPGVMIWGTLEARVQGADLVILGGLNDGVWPEAPKPDPWLNRSMRAKLGLLLPERRIGLSAHDFQQAMCAPHVMITRATRNAEAETVMSRWLNRLTNLMAGLPRNGGQTALKSMRARGHTWLIQARALEDRVVQNPRALRPAPCPPADHRLTRLSVTDIQRLVRDPYAIYARRILRLNPLDTLRKDPDAAMRGSLFHEIFEQFVKDGVDPSTPDAAQRFVDIARTLLDRTVPWAATRMIWLAKLTLLADWFVAQDARHRATGASPAALERRGALDVPGTAVTIRGEADRIDRLSDGSLAIMDYKTGKAPTNKQIRQYDPQVLIEAVMAEAGAFSDLPPARASLVGHVQLGGELKWQLHSLRDAGAKVPLSPEEGLAMLQRLLSAYADAGKGFMSRRAMETMGYDYGYDHLARYGEWGTADPASPVKLT